MSIPSDCPFFSPIINIDGEVIHTLKVKLSDLQVE